MSRAQPDGVEIEANGPTPDAAPGANDVDMKDKVLNGHDAVCLPILANISIPHASFDTRTRSF
jgi:hypothetical protein